MKLLSKFSQPKPLLKAVMSNSIQDVQTWIKRGVNLKQPPETGRASYLHYAVHTSPEMLTLLIRAGVDVNAVDDNGNTPLHLTATCGYPEIAALLIKSGANVNARNNSGKTALYCALVEPGPFARIGAPFRIAGVITPHSGHEIQEHNGKSAVAALLKSKKSQL